MAESLCSAARAVGGEEPTRTLLAVPHVAAEANKYVQDEHC